MDRYKSKTSDAAPGFKEEVLDKVKEMMTSRSEYWSRDVHDLDMSRSLSSGFGFDEQDEQYLGETKMEVTVNLLRPWVDQVVSSYDMDPFKLGLKTGSQQDISAVRQAFEAVQERSKIKDVASEALRQVINNGWAYLLVTSELENEEYNWQTPTIKLLDARKVICDVGEDSTLADCDLVVVVDVLKKDKASKKYGIEKEEYTVNSDILQGYDIVMDSKTQCSVLTVYEKVEGGVQVTKIVHHKIIDQVVLPGLSRVPVIRVTGESAFIDKLEHWRGAYHFVAGLLKLENYSTSEMQTRIATSESANWIVDNRSITNSVQDWTPNSGVSVKGVDSWDGERELAPPTRVDKSLQIAELIQATESTKLMIAEILGAPTAQGVSNETAEAVLTRRAAAEASTNRYLKNLKHAFEQAGQVTLEYMAFTYDATRLLENQLIPPLTEMIKHVFVDVTGGPLIAGQRTRTLQQLLAIQEMVIKAEQSPMAAKVLPVIIEASDLSMEHKKFLMQSLGGQQRIPPEVQQQMQQMQAENAQLHSQLQQALTVLQAQKDKTETDRMKIQADLLKSSQTIQKDLIIAEGKESGENTRLAAEMLAELDRDQRDIEKTIAAIEAKKTLEDRIAERVITLPRAPQNPNYRR